MKIIAYIYTDFPEKFGIPRQSGLVGGLQGRIELEPEFRAPEAVKGLEKFSYIWLLWQFQGTERENWSATVRPPRLGGKQRVGVFATRSPFRPNPIGLSSVRLDRIEYTEKGPVLYVSGIDLRDRTPIYDIKPYLPFADCHEDAQDGFAGEVKEQMLQVEFPPELLEILPAEKRQAACEVLKQDPRPRYQMHPQQSYGMAFAGYDIRFSVEGDILTVTAVVVSQE